jgi:hypothetical protein
MEWRVEGGGWRVEGGGWRVEVLFRLHFLDSTWFHILFYK